MQAYARTHAHRVRNCVFDGESKGGRRGANLSARTPTQAHPHTHAHTVGEGGLAHRTALADLAPAENACHAVVGSQVWVGDSDCETVK